MSPQAEEKKRKGSSSKGKRCSVEEGGPENKKEGD